MRINFVSFSDFNSDIEVYNLKKMDLFVYLLIEIITPHMQAEMRQNRMQIPHGIHMTRWRRYLWLQVLQIYMVLHN